MPGHVKKTSGPDPDPSPWLEVKYELKMKNKAKPYDPKKSCWVPDKVSLPNIHLHGSFFSLNILNIYRPLVAIWKV